MLPKRIELLNSMSQIQNLDGMTLYKPKNDERYTYKDIRIRFFWIDVRKEIFHSPDGEKITEIVWLVAELEDGKILHMVTSTYDEAKLEWILAEANIGVERSDSRQVNESDKNTNINSVSFSPPADNWIARFYRWVRSIFFR